MKINCDPKTKHSGKFVVPFTNTAITQKPIGIFWESKNNSHTILKLTDLLEGLGKETFQCCYQSLAHLTLNYCVRSENNQSQKESKRESINRSISIRVSRCVGLKFSYQEKPSQKRIFYSQVLHSRSFFPLFLEEAEEREDAADRGPGECWEPNSTDRGSRGDFLLGISSWMLELLLPATLKRSTLMVIKDFQLPCYTVHCHTLN